MSRVRVFQIGWKKSTSSSSSSSSWRATTSNLSTYDVRFLADGVVERDLPRSMLRRPSPVAEEEENADPAAPASCVVQKSDASVTVTEVSVRQPLTTLQG
jgi:hypothetical protein